MTIASPCTGVCKLDDATGWCLGCGRAGEEMAGWGTRSEVERGAIWGQIPDRLHQLGVACRRLPWTTDDIRAFVASTLHSGRGTWVMGVVGAVAEFTAAPGETVTQHSAGDDLVARTRNGAIRMTLNDDIRALTFDPPGTRAEPRIVLAVKRERGRVPLAQGVSDLGPDSGIFENEETAHLFDLGLGRKEGRFCVRLGDGPARQALRATEGLPFIEALPRIGAALVGESPTRVVDSALGRIEVQGQIPPPDARSPDGPHTHLLPDHLATGRALPVGMDLPRSYLPGAVYYPPNPPRA
ncbi:MAG: DUF1289 domain-containing protein [Pseudomonadota bacterium]